MVAVAWRSGAVDRVCDVDFLPLPDYGDKSTFAPVPK